MKSWKCWHRRIINDQRQYQYQWVPVESKELAKQNAFLFRCALCNVFIVKQLVAESTVLGMRWKSLNYYCKTEFHETETFDELLKIFALKNGGKQCSCNLTT